MGRSDRKWLDGTPSVDYQLDKPPKVENVLMGPFQMADPTVGEKLKAGKKNQKISFHRIG